MKKLMMAAALVVAQGTASAEAEEQTLNAMAAWLGTGEIFKVAPDRAFFAGKLGGMVFAATEGSDTMHAALLACPGTLEVSLEDGKQVGKGHCVITQEDGSVVYASWTCEGTHTAGCAGDFVLTGGTGQFEGIKGQGPFVIRSALRSVAVDMVSGSVSEEALGVMVWENLTYTLP